MKYLIIIIIFAQLYYKPFFHNFLNLPLIFIKLALFYFVAATGSMPDILNMLGIIRTRALNYY